jgi:hypothetical protein
MYTEFDTLRSVKETEWLSTNRFAQNVVSY